VHGLHEEEEVEKKEDEGIEHLQDGELGKCITISNFGRWKIGEHQNILFLWCKLIRFRACLKCILLYGTFGPVRRKSYIERARKG
jgi:hypothetical protein